MRAEGRGARKTKFFLAPQPSPHAPTQQATDGVVTDLPEALTTSLVRAFLFLSSHGRNAHLHSPRIDQLDLQQRAIVRSGVTSTNQSSFNASIALTNGTGATGTANLIYALQTTIAGGGNTTITLDSGITDFFGTGIVMVRCKVMFIALTAATAATSVQVGNGSNPFINWVGAAAHTIQIRNGGFFLLACADGTAYAVTASTGDVLKILNNDGSNVATLQIALVGSTA